MFADQLNEGMSKTKSANARNGNIPFNVYAFSSQVDMFHHYGLHKDRNNWPKQMKVDGSRTDYYKDSYRNDGSGIAVGCIYLWLVG